MSSKEMPSLWSPRLMLEHLDCQAVTRHYMARPEPHHQKLSFQDEFRLFLKRCEIAFNERYLWD